MENSKISYDGDGNMFYVTNTKTKVSMKNCELKYDGKKLISAAAGRWGCNGSNGGTLTMTTDSQTLKGKISADKISKITLKLKNKSTFNGSTSGSVKIDKDDSSTVKK
jgi:hypothetical protein